MAHIPRESGGHPDAAICAGSHGNGAVSLAFEVLWETDEQKLHATVEGTRRNEGQEPS